jgi:hypothetical protein
MKLPTSGIAITVCDRCRECLHSGRNGDQHDSSTKRGSRATGDAISAIMLSGHFPRVKRRSCAASASRCSFSFADSSSPRAMTTTVSGRTAPVAVARVASNAATSARRFVRASTTVRRSAATIACSTARASRIALPRVAQTVRSTAKVRARAARRVAPRANTRATTSTIARPPSGRTARCSANASAIVTLLVRAAAS